MPSQIIYLDAWIKGSTTICNRRSPEFALEWMPRHLGPFGAYRYLSPSRVSP